ncbi:MAG TPA: 4-(cytidine 5'-diphospho)-2-C-methyl-D-erythritol kinase [Ktedonobacterales bacterium]
MAWTRGAMVPAFAKINLTLEVLGRRADGYHDLVSVLCTIALHDTIALRPAPAGTFSLVCDDPALAGDDNLALRAARLLAATLDPAPATGVAIELHKAIPVQAGLGGGSSDAAMVLAALYRLWDRHLSGEQFAALAARLGSDVPFFLTPGAALVRGRGERVEALPDIEPLWLVLLKPPVAVATAAAFGALTPADFGDGAASEAMAAALLDWQPLPPDGQELPLSGQELPLDRLVNSFEPSILRDYPAVARAWEEFAAAGAPLVRLSGSGPTLYAPFRELASAAAVHQRLRAGGHQTWLTYTVPRIEATPWSRIAP